MIIEEEAQILAAIHVKDYTKIVRYIYDKMQ